MLKNVSHIIAQLLLHYLRTDVTVEYTKCPTFFFYWMSASFRLMKCTPSSSSSRNFKCEHSTQTTTWCRKKVLTTEYKLELTTYYNYTYYTQSLLALSCWLTRTPVLLPMPIMSWHFGFLRWVLLLFSRQPPGENFYDF